MTFIPKSWTPRDGELDGKSILVTGAGDGIGRAAALSFARHGAEVLLLGRTETKLDSVYDTIVNEGGVTPAVIPADLAQTSHDQWLALAGELSGALSCLHGLLHNASLLGDRKPLSQTSAAAWHEIMQVNVNAAFMLTQALLPMLQEAPRASVVFTSSSVGRRGRAYWGGYAVSKFATEGLMQVLADELGSISDIRVNSLNPGAVNTAMRRTAYPAEPPQTNPAPESLMDHWIFLMSDASKDLHGEALSVQS